MRRHNDSALWTASGMSQPQRERAALTSLGLVQTSDWLYFSASFMPGRFAFEVTKALTPVAMICTRSAVLRPFVHFMRLLSPMHCTSSFSCMNGQPVACDKVHVAGWGASGALCDGSELTSVCIAI